LPSPPLRKLSVITCGTRCNEPFQSRTVNFFALCKVVVL
jgi:hypothetical protein